MNVRGRARPGARLRSALVACAVAAAAAVMGACLGPAPAELDAVTTVRMPDEQIFINAGVSRVLEARCGTIDCHGQMGRPLRIFGGTGLRLAEGTDSPGSSPTTAEEMRENYLAAVGLEPEAMTRVVGDEGQAPERLLLVTKPRNQVVHKGGQIWLPRSPGDTCVRAWLRGTEDGEACRGAL